MKTSNKLLTILLLLVFATPLLLALNLKRKIKNQEYTLLKSDSPNNVNGNYHGSFGNYKVLKLIAPFKVVFNCRLRPSKTPSYSYTDYDPDQDHLHIYNKADTLYMEYVADHSADIHSTTDNPNPSLTTSYVTIGADIGLPSFEKLEIKGATAIIDSLPDGLKSMEITLSDGGELKMGENGSKEELETPSSKTLTRISCGVTDLTVNATGSDVFFGPYFMAVHLHLHLSGTSSLTLKDAIIQKFDGSLSDSIIVNANWKYLRQLAPLTER